MSREEELMKNELNNDINNVFEDFLIQGEIRREKEVVEGLTVEVKPLNAEELITAESIASETHSGSMDVVAKIRAAGILSQAITKFAGVPIEKKDCDKKENRYRRINLYCQILKMPPFVIQKIYEFYIEVVEEQEKLYSDTEKTIEDFKNF